jgi:hypothetical protein
MLSAEERATLTRQQLIEHAIVLYLDTTAPHTQASVAQELGLSLEALKTLTRSDDFMDTYNLHFTDLGHDPRLKASQAAIADMLSPAIRRLKHLLEDDQTPPSVQLKAIEMVLKLGGIEQPKPAQNDKKDLAAFLEKAAPGVNIENMMIMNNPMPPEYQDPFAFSRDDTIEVIPTEVPTPEGILEEGQITDS